jgi:hypothetical protein
MSRILGFGRRVSWFNDLDIPPGHQMSFKNALHILSNHVVLKFIVPDWAKDATELTRKIHLAFCELKVRCLNHLDCVSVTPPITDASSSNTCWTW